MRRSLSLWLQTARRVNLDGVVAPRAKPTMLKMHVIAKNMKLCAPSSLDHLGTTHQTFLRLNMTSACKWTYNCKFRWPYICSCDGIKIICDPVFQHEVISLKVPSKIIHLMNKTATLIVIGRSGQGRIRPGLQPNSASGCPHFSAEKLIILPFFAQPRWNRLIGVGDYTNRLRSPTVTPSHPATDAISLHFL